MIKIFPVLFACIILSFLAGHYWVNEINNSRAGWVFVLVAGIVGFVISSVVLFSNTDMD